MNTKLFKTSLVVVVIGCIGLFGWYLQDAAVKREAKLKSEAVGEWVAVEGFCNDAIKGIQGIDITPEYILKNGKRYPIERIDIVNKNITLDSCELGPIQYDFEFAFYPSEESFLNGTLGDFSVIKSLSDATVYFKMTPEFKKQYELMVNKTTE
ncbi:hypothetical protein [Shewanella algicola]|uniref:hypothetical protein n=1 Tax=Shewanella algicola TaxID=640633 RepID=UPI00249494E2|nr:hypothetical protein [Shewanella algicola]